MVKALREVKADPEGEVPGVGLEELEDGGLGIEGSGAPCLAGIEGARQVVGVLLAPDGGP
eukprot:8405943-Alexandrium_andersonii.AAC.1